MLSTYLTMNIKKPFVTLTLLASFFTGQAQPDSTQPDSTFYVWYLDHATAVSLLDPNMPTPDPADYPYPHAIYQPEGAPFYQIAPVTQSGLHGSSLPSGWMIGGVLDVFSFPVIMMSEEPGYPDLPSFESYLNGPPYDMMPIGNVNESDDPQVPAGSSVYYLPPSYTDPLGISAGGMNGSTAPGTYALTGVEHPYGFDIVWFLVEEFGPSMYRPVSMPMGGMVDTNNPIFYDDTGVPGPMSNANEYLYPLLGGPIGIFEEPQPLSIGVGPDGPTTPPIDDSGPFPGSQPPSSGSDPGGPMVHGVNVVPMPAAGIYRVEYSIDIMPGEIFYVEAFFSTDGGNTWSEITSMDHSMGPPAFGPDASYGGGSHNFHWDASMDAPGVSVPDARVRVVATTGNVPGGFKGPGILMGNYTTPAPDPVPSTPMDDIPIPEPIVSSVPVGTTIEPVPAVLLFDQDDVMSDYPAMMDDPAIMDDPAMYDPAMMDDPAMMYGPGLMYDPAMMDDPAMYDPAMMDDPAMYDPAMMDDPAMMYGPGLMYDPAYEPYPTDPAMVDDPMMYGPAMMDDPAYEPYPADPAGISLDTIAP